MSKKIDVILLEPVAGVGAAGDIVSVSEGFARNRLFPDGKAALATANAQKEKSEHDRAVRRAAEADLAKRQAQAEQLDGTELTIVAQVKDGNEIFGSISAAQVAKELARQAKISIAAKDIDLPEPLVKVGSTEVTVHFGEGVEASLRVTIVPIGPEARNDTT